jgi:hypothetical protein
VSNAFGQLLRDRRRATQTTLTLQRLPDRQLDLRELEPVVGEEADVLCHQYGPFQVGRDGVVRNPLPLKLCRLIALSRKLEIAVNEGRGLGVLFRQIVHSRPSGRLIDGGDQQDRQDGRCCV